MITREKIKSLNNCYKLDMTCVCITSYYLIFAANSIKTRSFFFLFLWGCLYIFLAACHRSSFLTSNSTQVQIQGTAVPHVERVGERNTFFFGYFATEDVSAAVAHLQCSGKRSWIRRNKLPVDVVGAGVNHSQSN